uniref:Uncharacterized protein n=1 Tax=Anas platyrhynchos TaxID=8839 RepID=A0A8B9TBV4_ANAPL
MGGRGAKQGVGRGVLGYGRAPPGSPTALPSPQVGRGKAVPLHPSLPSSAAAQGDALGRGHGGRITPLGAWWVPTTFSQYRCPESRRSSGYKSRKLLLKMCFLLFSSSHPGGGK